jgi:septation ring formation regulator EzrA
MAEDTGRLQKALSDEAEKTLKTLQLLSERMPKALAAYKAKTPEILRKYQGAALTALQTISEKMPDALKEYNASVLDTFRKDAGAATQELVEANRKAFEALRRHSEKILRGLGEYSENMVREGHADLQAMLTNLQDHSKNIPEVVRPSFEKMIATIKG